MALRRYFGKISPLAIGNLVGHNGELVIDEVTDKIYIMDGVTPGGHEIANVQANLNLEYTNVVPAINSTYNLGSQNYAWGNLYLTGYINPSLGVNNWGNLRINASRINADRLYAQTDISVDGSLTANTIFSNGFVEINATNYTGFTFSGLGTNTTGLIHANIGNISTVAITSNGNSNFTAYGNGFNTIGGYTQFYQNVYITGNNLTIPNNTTIGLLPNFTPTNARLTYTDNVNTYTQFVFQNKNSGSNASGDIVVTSDNGTDATHYIDLGINSSTFNGGGGLDGPDDGYLLVEGGKLVIGTINQPNDIVLAVGGDAPANEKARFSQNSIVLSANNTTQYSSLNLSELDHNYLVANINNYILSGNGPLWTTAYWNFDATGNLTLPNDSSLVSNAYGDGNQTTTLRSAPAGYALIGSHTLNNYIQVDDNAIYIGTDWPAHNYSWTFDINGNLTTPGSIIPGANVAYSLGDINHQWKDLYVSNGSIYMGGVPVRLQNGNLVVNGNVVGGGFGSTNQALNTTSNPTFNNLSATGNVTIQGNLIVNGNTTTVSTQNLIINDNIIYIANGNPGSTLDIGFAGHFTAGVYQHTGLVRQASSNVWKLFSNVVAEPGNTIDFTSAVYDALQTGTLISPTITDIYNNLASLTSNASTQASNLATLTSNAATQATNLATITNNLATITSNLGGIVGGTTTLANVITTGGLFWSNGVSALTSAYGNTQVAAYYVANTVATSNVQILNNGNIRLPTGATISESAGSGTITLSPNTSVNALAGVAIGGLGYLLSANGTRNAVLNLNGVNGQFGVYTLNTYGNQANAIINGGSNNYGNIGSISSFYGNAFVSNIYSPNYLYPNGISILTGVGSSYGDSNVATYLAGNVSIGNIALGIMRINGSEQNITTTNGSAMNFGSRLNINGTAAGIGLAVTGNISAGAATATFGNVITTGGVFYANGISYSSGGGTYGNTQVAAYLPTYTGNVNAGNINVTANVNAANINVTNNLTYGNVSTTGNVTAGYFITTGTGGNISGANYVNATNFVATANTSAAYVNATTGVYSAQYYWSNGTVFSSGGSGTPSGGNTMIQFNDAGSFGGATYIQYNKTSGNLVSNSTTAATSTTTGALVVGGGMGVGGAIYSGGNIVVGSGANLLVGSGQGGFLFRTLVGGTSAAIYNLNVVPSAQNYSIATNGSSLNINTPTGGGIYSSINNSIITTVQSGTGSSVSSSGQSLVVASGGLGVTGDSYISGNLGVSGDIFTNTGNLRSTSSIGNVFNFSATTVNIGNAATGIYMGSSTANVNVAGNVVAKNSLYTDNHLYANGVPYAGTYSNSNVASYLPTYTGNVGAGNLIGTSSNVTITSGANVWTFDNTGNLSLPNLSATYILAANTNGNININTVGTGSVNVSGNLTIGGINAGYAPNRPAFRVYGSNSYQWQGGNTIVAGSVDYNQGSYYNAITGIFTAPIAGLYHAYATLRVGSNNGLNQASIQKNSNNSGANVISFWETDTNTGTATHFSMTGYAKLVAGDTIRLQSISGNINIDSNDSWGVTYIG